MLTVSVVMPAYNCEKTIIEAVESVLSQTYSDFELLIIEDCSKDNTRKVIEKLAGSDERIKLLINDKNSGASYSRNRGVKEAKGQWIAFLDSDDIWREDKLEKQMQMTKKFPDAVLFYTASAFMTEEGNRYSYIMEAQEKISYKELLSRNLVSCSSVLVKSEIMKNIKMPGDEMSEDYYTWLKILQDNEYAYGVNEPLLIYRLMGNSKSSNRLKAAKMTYNTYRAVGYNVLVAAWLVFKYTFYSVTKRFKIKHI